MPFTNRHVVITGGSTGIGYAAAGRAVFDERHQPTKLVGLVYDETERKRAEDELREHAAQLRMIQEAALIGTFVTAPDGRTVGSRQYFRNLGLSDDREYLDAEAWRLLIHPEDRERVLLELAAAKDGGAAGHDTEYRIVHASSGEVRWIFARNLFERDAQGALVRLLGAHLDITGAKHAAEALQESEALSRGVVEASADCILLLDLDGTLRHINGPGLAALEIDDPTDYYGQSWPRLWPWQTRGKVERALAAARGGQPGRFNAGCPTVKGRPRWWDVVITALADDHGRAVRLLCICRDVTEDRSGAERIRWAANHDGLTRLSNRRFFHEMLQKMPGDGVRPAKPFGLMLLDLDNFKHVNDSLGHDAGDALLQTVAERLRNVQTSEEFVARIGGDEFAILIPEVEGPDEVEMVAERVLAEMQEPFVYRRSIIDCGISIGAAIWPEDGSEPDMLLQNADIALYAAKAEGRARASLFRPEMRAHIERQALMVASARGALARQEVFPYYQPKICLRTGRIVGFEALLRWRGTNGSVQKPAAIQAAFEDVGVAPALSERIQDRLLSDVRQWLDQGIAFGHVAFNAAAAEFRRNDFAERLCHKMEVLGIAPEHLQLEVTETVFLAGGAEYVKRALQRLSEHGIRIALDDFGTGYASLSHLKKYPVDVIKIDRSFINELSNDEGGTAIVLALLDLARNLKIEVVAEGVESSVQAEFLRSQGCDQAQGYLFGEAIPARDVDELLRSGITTAGELTRAAG